MMEAAKTLNEMTRQERSEMISMTAGALEAAVDDARKAGDARLVANLTSLAMTIRGCSSDTAADNIRAVELLLQQAIELVSSCSRRGRGSAAIH